VLDDDIIKVYYERLPAAGEPWYGYHQSSKYGSGMLEDHIRAHMLLCWLALWLIRIAENRTGQTWCNLRATLQRMHLGEFSGAAGQVWQRTETTPAQEQIFKALAVKEPPRLFSISPAGKKDA